MNTPCPLELSRESFAIHADPDGPGAAGAYASQELGSGALVRRSRRVKAAATDAEAEVRFDRALSTALCTLWDMAVSANRRTDASWRGSWPGSNSLALRTAAHFVLLNVALSGRGRPTPRACLDLHIRTLV